MRLVVLALLVTGMVSCSEDEKTSGSPDGAAAACSAPCTPDHLRCSTSDPRKIEKCQVVSGCASPSWGPEFTCDAGNVCYQETGEPNAVCAPPGLK